MFPHTGVILQILISLTTIDNDYQQEQAAAAEAAARRLGVRIRIVHADNDAIKQSQQLLEAIQSPAASRPAAIALEPVGTALPKVAQAAAGAGMAWVVLSRGADYVTAVRKASRTSIFAISTDHVEVGRIQGPASWSGEKAPAEAGTEAYHHLAYEWTCIRWRTRHQAHDREITPHCSPTRSSARQILGPSALPLPRWQRTRRTSQEYWQCPHIAVKYAIERRQALRLGQLPMAHGAR